MDLKPSCLDGGPIPSTSSPIVEQQLSDTNNARFFIMKKSDSFSNVSPFLIEKAITASVGSVKTIRKMRSGDLFLELSSAKQASALINLRQLANFETDSDLNQPNSAAKCSSKSETTNSKSGVKSPRKNKHAQLREAKGDGRKKTTQNKEN
ncbi:hypothetical protein NPIL_216671 [Nephila pilipes]|uniref:Uncharacterized protein n=1 Tax=Nephila pilipes TaxID=299642 RepID=A0A8X6UTU6_NEPPI|nr:hypothetical protein NPIL_216671 [Nephila pilipes]